MRKLVSALLVGGALLASPAFAGEYSVKTTTIGDLMANPDTLAIFQEHLPDVVNHPQIDMGKFMTLAEAQSYEPGLITDAKLEAMQADLDALSAGE